MDDYGFPYRFKIPDFVWDRIHAQLEREGVIPSFPRKPLDVEECLATPLATPPPHESVYELTMTTPNDDPYQLRQAFQAICDSAMVDCAMAYACIELTKAGLPHIHAIVYSRKKYLDAGKLKRFHPHRYELKRVRQLDNYINYIQKEFGNPSIEDYCLKKGVPQFWYHGNAEEI